MRDLHETRRCILLDVNEGPEEGVESNQWTFGDNHGKKWGPYDKEESRGSQVLS